jgi:hypothetical protein
LLSPVLEVVGGVGEVTTQYGFGKLDWISKDDSE